jgi:cardiolipin synthase A/B
MRALFAVSLAWFSFACTAPPEIERSEAEASACEATDPRERRVSVVIAPDDGDGALLGLIDAAVHSVDVTIYQLSNDRVIAALAAAAARSVRVRIIVDADEAIPAVVDRLRAAGVTVHPSSPEFVHTHQKSVVVDARTAFVFSGNFDGRAFVRGRNYGVIDDDRADVQDLETVFEADWTGSAFTLPCTRLVLSPLNARARILSIIAQARSALDVEAMYVTDREVEAAIVSAHQRGVSVRVLLNDPSYDIGHVDRLAARLRSVGIDVKRSGTRFIHAKLLLADSARAFVGSENFSRTALDDNREVGIVVSDRDSDVDRIVRTFAADWASAPAFETTP